MNDKTYNVALLSNFTIKGLDEQLKKSAKRYGVSIGTYLGEYGQWQQEILGEKLYQLNPDMVYVVVDFEDVDSQVGMIDQLALKTNAKIVVCNKVFESGLSSNVNNALNERFKDNPQIRVFDFNTWLESIGKEKHWNTKYRELGDMRLAPAAFPQFANELAAYLVPLAGKTKKCLVLDLDNVLWGRIVGEDGIQGIALGPEGEGKPFYEFQKYVKTLQERGVILAIASSNNEADVKEVFEKHEHMVLREDNFASIRANWNNKAQNIQEIAEELNIGLDSLVFMDDDPRNRELVRESIPEVAVIEMPTDPREYAKTLAEYKGFTSFGVTEEDKKRAAMYADEKKRRSFKEASIDMDSFLRGLGIAITMQPVSDASIARAAQLTQKTNQFNLTTHRYQEEDIRDMLTQGFAMWILDVKDKFGDYGLTGLAVACDAGEYWDIDTLLLSCRVLGKRVEEEFFSCVLNQLKSQDAKKVIGTYIPTAKNGQVKDFYQKFGFTKQQSGAGEVWERDLASYEHKPLDFISITVI
ncbi:MAG: HAD-IIIC family phosphatase [Patescibacteria group bacterium]